MSASSSSQFAAACGLTGPLELEVSSHDHDAARYSFDRPWVVLGRAERSTLCLDESAISQRHAYLQVLAGRLFAVDLESRTGIQVEDAPLRAGWIDTGNKLNVGPYQMQLVSPLVATPTPMVNDPLEDRMPTSGAFPLASFDIYEGALHVARWRLNRVLSLVGRSARCRVRLPDVSVSCVHCSVVATPNGIWVVDLLSREGTQMNGEAIHLARMEEGDTLEVGNYRLRIYYHNGQKKTVSAPLGESKSMQTRLPLSVSSPSSLVVVRDDHASLVAQRTQTPSGESQMLVPLVQQFGVMQQEMFDQFQRTMMMMMQMFTTMHQEQVGLLKEEMRQFQQTTLELHAAQRELRDRQNAMAAERGQAPLPTPAPMPQSSPPPTRQPFPFPTVSQPTPPFGGAKTMGTWKVDDTAPINGTPIKSEVAGNTEQPDLDAALPDDGAEVHDWLTDRIASLESERQTRWQRILSFMKMGGS